MRFNFGDTEVSEVATRMKTRVSVDTSAICFNPVTKRFEVVQSKREDMSIHLFSIRRKIGNRRNGVMKDVFQTFGGILQHG